MFASGVFRTENQGVSFELARFDDNAGKIVAKYVHLVGLFFCVPSQNQQAFEITGRPFRMQGVDE